MAAGVGISATQVTEVREGVCGCMATAFVTVEPSMYTALMDQ